MKLCRCCNAVREHVLGLGVALITVCVLQCALESDTDRLPDSFQGKTYRCGVSYGAGGQVGALGRR